MSNPVGDQPNVIACPLVQSNGMASNFLNVRAQRDFQRVDSIAQSLDGRRSLDIHGVIVTSSERRPAMSSVASQKFVVH